MSIYKNLVYVTDTIYCSRECALKLCNTRIPKLSFQEVFLSLICNKCKTCHTYYKNKV